MSHLSSKPTAAVVAQGRSLLTTRAAFKLPDLPYGTVWSQPPWSRCYLMEHLCIHMAHLYATVDRQDALEPKISKVRCVLQALLGPEQSCELGRDTALRP